MNIIEANVATPDARVAITIARFNNFINIRGPPSLTVTSSLTIKLILASFFRVKLVQADHTTQLE